MAIKAELEAEPRIELVYDRGCPNVERARTRIREALGLVGAPLAWTEWDRDGAETPDMLRALGSPTVLVNGRDIGCDENGNVEAEANLCRVYVDDTGCLCGAPTARLIVEAIRGKAAQ